MGISAPEGNWREGGGCDAMSLGGRVGLECCGRR